MALKINYEDVSGTIHPEAYVRISKAIIENPVSGLKDVSIDVCVYSSQAARQAGKVPVWGPQGFQVQQPAGTAGSGRRENRPWRLWSVREPGYRDHGRDLHLA